MTLTVIIVSLAIIILIILPQIAKRITYKKLTTHLGKREYEQFETLLDGFICTFSFRPYNREFMRLNAYFMQADTKKIEAQLDTMFTRLKMKEEQKAAVAKQGFYFYLENKNYTKAEKMLKICRKDAKNENEVHVMDMMYDILALQKSDHIQEIKSRLDSIKKQPNLVNNPAQRVRLGIFEYLLGLQYAYQNNKKTSKNYLESALKNCVHTPYEPQILALLKQKG